MIPKGAKTWEEMRAELPPETQRYLDQVAEQKARARQEKEQSSTAPSKDAKPAA